MRVTLTFIGLLALPAMFVASLPSVAADEQPTGGRVPTVTRLVKLFLEKEASLGAAVRNGDPTALGGLLTDDFELRTGARAASPIPRADWMRELLRTRDPGGDISRMRTRQVEMDVRRANGIRPRGISPRFDCRETVTAISAGHQDRVSQEIGIERCGIRVVRVCVASRRVGLPYFHPHTGNGFSRGR